MGILLFILLYCGNSDNSGVREQNYKKELKGEVRPKPPRPKKIPIIIKE